MKRYTLNATGKLTLAEQGPVIQYSEHITATEEYRTALETILAMARGEDAEKAIRNIIGRTKAALTN